MSIRDTEMTGSLESSRHFRKQQKLQKLQCFLLFYRGKAAATRDDSKIPFCSSCMIWSKGAEYNNRKIL